MAKGKTSTMCLTQDDATPAHSAFFQGTIEKYPKRETPDADGALSP
jgi:hypothetical protein